MERVLDPNLNLSKPIQLNANFFFASAAHKVSGFLANTEDFALPGPAPTI